MNKKIYIKPQSIVIAPLCDGEIMDGMHGASYDIDGKGGEQGSSQDGTPVDKWWENENYDEESTTPTSIFNL